MSYKPHPSHKLAITATVTLWKGNDVTTPACKDCGAHAYDASVAKKCRPNPDFQKARLAAEGREKIAVEVANLEAQGMTAASIDTDGIKAVPDGS